MTRTAIALSFPWFVGSTLLLSGLRRVRRPRFAERLAPYAPSRGRAPRPRAILSLSAFREVVGSLALDLGGRASRLLGVGEDLDTRLRRIHAPIDATDFRVRQLARAAGAFTGATAVAVLFRLGAAPAALLVIGGPVLVHLTAEHGLARSSEAWQRRIFLELPMVAEQLAMLLSAGWSLGAAIQRTAERGRGACATDLGRVTARMRQGLTEVDALREWSALARVDALDRLVRVLALDREAADLARLVAHEARAIRRDAQRQLVETIERRSQQVWIPVTVAALLPGVLLMGVPFVAALTLFSA